MLSLLSFAVTKSQRKLGQNSFLKQSRSAIRHNTDPVFNTTLAYEESLIFLWKVTARETQARKRERRDKRRRIHYYNVTSLYAIALAQIRTRLILREKEDGKQRHTLEMAS